MPYGYNAVYFRGNSLDALYRGTERIYPDENFTIENRTATQGTITFTAVNTPNALQLYVSTDDGATWIDSQFSSTTTFTIPANGRLTIDGRRNGGLFSSYTEYWTIDSDVDIDVYGDLATLGGDSNNTISNNYEYVNLFINNQHLINAGGLILSATTLTTYCYHSMFEGCTSLTAAPELSATTLATYCCFNMFSGCTSLTTAPELPATTLADACYLSMFEGCTSLTVTPELPATTLAYACYQMMFNGCTSLTVAPELPATTLSGFCYCGMFDDCTSLTTAPELPVTTLAEDCYDHMFSGCTSLIAAPALPATTLASGCYFGMFSNCTSLTTSPLLAAATLTFGCYQDMFIGCTALSSITCLATDISANLATDYWVAGVGSNGTFYCEPTMTNVWTQGINGYPSTWNIVAYQ